METRNYDFDADTLSDLHKDAYGFRPRSEEFWAEWDSADNDGKQRIWDRILDDLDRALETEREIQQEAIAEFNRRVSHYCFLKIMISTWLFTSMQIILLQIITRQVQTVSIKFLSTRVASF